MNHPVQKPRGRERSLPLQQEESQAKKRSIHVINGTLFLPVTGKRKGTFPSGSGERKGPLWGENPAPVTRKKKKSTGLWPYQTGKWTLLACPLCWRGRMETL